MKNKNTISFLVLVFGIAFLLITSLLLDLQFFKAAVVRQIIVYFIMLCEAFVMFRILKNVNKQ